MDDQEKPRIVIKKNGPYFVDGRIPFVRKAQVVSEFGEPLAWKKEGDLPTDPDGYRLCRCGRSKTHPFCDLTHRTIPFDGTETASPDPLKSRQFTFPGGTHLVVKKDTSLCIESGFCGLRNTTIAKLIAASNDGQARALAMAMVEHCPSGALTYSIEEGLPDIEPDLPVQIADTTEILDEGPIAGPLWVTGEIEIVRSDGQTVEVRNRVTLCNCGLSRNKPFCDGTHRGDLSRLRE